MYKRFLKTREEMVKATRALKWNFKFKTLTVVCMMLTMSNSLYAKSAFTNAAKTLNSYQSGIQSITYAVATLVGLIGAGRIYFKYQSGDQDLMKSMIQWGGSFVFLLAAAAAIPTLLS